MVEKIVSERFSFEGWELGKFIKGNWKTIKEVGKVAIPYVTSWLITQDMTVQIFLTGAGKALLDAIEYYVKEKKE